MQPSRPTYGAFGSDKNMIERLGSGAVFCNENVTEASFDFGTHLALLQRRRGGLQTWEREDLRLSADARGQSRTDRLHDVLT